jgi:hypothetical protein
MSTYSVSNIFYPQDWYDILIQDTDIRFNITDANSIMRDRAVDVTLAKPGLTEKVDISFNCQEPSRTELTIRSRDGMDQRLKQLTRMDAHYPLLYKYNKTDNEVANQVRFSLYYERGVPDYFFIFAETLFEGVTDFEMTAENPRINSINFFGRVNKTKSLCSYLLDEDELWNATRRNSHPKASITELREIGGVLLNHADLGTLERNDFKKNDCFDYDVLVTYDRSHLKNQATQSVKVHLVAVFEDKLVFQGGVDEMSFFEEARYAKY